MQDKIFRISLIGPESSGKTFLAEALAKHFNTIWVPEFARHYVENLNRLYTKEDILYCAIMQFESEQLALLNANKFLFADTEMINNSVWLKDVYAETDEWIEENISANPYDLYLLLKPDLPFINDPVRENEHRRDFFFDWYKRELDKRSLNYAVISGKGDERMKNAIRDVEKIIV